MSRDQGHLGHRKRGQRSSALIIWLIMGRGARVRVRSGGRWPATSAKRTTGAKWRAQRLPLEDEGPRRAEQQVELSANSGSLEWRVLRPAGMRAYHNDLSQWNGTRAIPIALVDGGHRRSAPRMAVGGN